MSSFKCIKPFQHANGSTFTIGKTYNFVSNGCGMQANGNEKIRCWFSDEVRRLHFKKIYAED